jgi:hypothetical protein
MRIRMIHWLVAGMLLGTTAQAQDVSYSVGAFPLADWNETVLVGPGTYTVSRTPLGSMGNPNDALWLSASAPQASTGTNAFNLVWINPSLTYNPQLLGAIDRFEFNIDARGANSSGISSQFFGFLRPMIRQNGNFYSGGVSTRIESTDWTTLNWQHAASDQWFSAVGSSGQPDFSDAGSLIEFGFRWEASTTCSAAQCSAVQISAFVDNFRTEVWAAEPISVPEPSSLALLGTGALALLMRRRRARVA